MFALQRNEYIVKHMRNTKLYQRGFSHVLVLLLMIVVLGVGFVGWYVMNKSSDDDAKKSDNNSQSTETTSEENIQLQNFGIESLDDVDITQYAVREYANHGLKGFYIFGDSLSGGRTNPNFEFSSLKEGTKLVSAIDGIVAHINQQPDSSDYEVFIQPKEGSAWTVGYDHVVSLNVKKGDQIKVGDVIGEPGKQNNGLLRFELQINKDENGATTHYCPSTLLAANVKDKTLADLLAMQNSWETTTSLELYNVDAQDPIGCTKPSMTSEEAES